MDCERHVGARQGIVTRCRLVGHGRESKLVVSWAPFFMPWRDSARRRWEEENAGCVKDADMAAKCIINALFYELRRCITRGGVVSRMTALYHA